MAFVQRNWFKLSILTFGFYLFFIKQLSLQVLIQGDDKTEQQVVRKGPKEKITENFVQVQKKADKLDHFEIPFIGERKPARNANAELKTINETAKHAYIQRFAEVARAEQEQYGVPASVILGMALHQSTAGKRDIAIQNANHFALPCSSDWKSACKSFHGSSYRKYESPWFSFRDFSKYVDANYRNLNGGTYQNYANAFQNDGFGEDREIGENLVEIIEGYRLYELDK